jgi:hypothetical protein
LIHIWVFIHVYYADYQEGQREHPCDTLSYVCGEHEMLEFLETTIPLLVSTDNKDAANKCIEPTVYQDDRIGTVPSNKDEVEHPGGSEDHETYEIQGLEHS